MNDKPISTKEYLSQAYRIDQRINAKLEQLEHLRALTQKVTASYGSEPVSHTRNVSSMEDVIIRLIETEHDLNHTIDELVDIKMDIAQCINAVPNRDYQLLLEKRYLCFHTWEKIAADMHYSARWVQVVHSRSLNAVGRILRERSARMEGCADNKVCTRVPKSAHEFT